MLSDEDQRDLKPEEQLIHLGINVKAGGATPTCLSCNASEEFIPLDYRYSSCSSTCPITEKVHNYNDTSVECILHVYTGKGPK